MESVGGELSRVALGRSETADCGVDRVDIDQSGLEDWSAIDHLRDGCGCGAGRTAALRIEGDRANPPIGHRERDTREIPTGSPTCSPRKGTISRRPKPRLISQVVLKELPLHAMKGRAPCRNGRLPHLLAMWVWVTASPRTPRLARPALTHTYLPCGCA